MAEEMIDIMEWKKKSIMLQDQHSSLLNDRIYDKFTSAQNAEFRRRVMSVLFRFKPDVLSTLGQRMVEDQWAQIEVEDLFEESDIKKGDQIVDLIKKYSLHSTHFDIAHIYVCVFRKGKEDLKPIIRVRKSNEQNESLIKNDTFIDHLGRVYDSWDYFLKNNTFDMSTLCVPADGYYSRKYNYEFIDQSSRGYVKDMMNNASTIGTIGSTLTAAAGLVMTCIPPTAPIGAGLLTASTVVAVPTGVGSTISAVKETYDRYYHCQSLSLFDSEARAQWFSLCLNVSSMCSLGATRYLSNAAAAGSAVPRFARICSNAAYLSTLGFGGIATCQQIYNGYLNWSELTPHDILQISSAVLLFGHGALNFRSANTVIDDALNNRIDQFKENLGKKDQVKIDELAKKSIAQHGSERGKQIYVQNLNDITNIRAYLSQWRVVAGKLEAPGSKHLPSNRIITPQQRIQRASHAAVRIAAMPVANFTPSETSTFSKILSKLDDSSHSVFIDLLSNSTIRDFFHMTKLLDTFLKRMSDKIYDMRVADPNPTFENYETVPEFFQKEEVEPLFSMLIRSGEMTAESLLENEEYVIRRFVPELHTLPMKKFAEFADQMVDFESNKEWIEHETFLICRCTPVHDGTEERIQEVKFSPMPPFINAVNLQTQNLKRF